MKRYKNDGMYENAGMVVNILIGFLTANCLIFCMVIFLLPKLIEIILDNYYYFLFIFVSVIILYVGGLALAIKAYEATRKKPRHSRSKSSFNENPENWEELKMQLKARDGNKCSNCGSTKNLHIHHIVPLSKGGTNNIGNLQILCRSCHKTLHLRMR